MVSIFSIPMSIQLGVALAQTHVAFCEHWDETLVLAVFKHHHLTGMVIYSFQNRCLSLSDIESNSRDISGCKMKKGGV